MLILNYFSLFYLKFLLAPLQEIKNNLVLSMTYREIIKKDFISDIDEKNIKIEKMIYLNVKII